MRGPLLPAGPDAAGQPPSDRRRRLPTMTRSVRRRAASRLGIALLPAFLAACASGDGTTGPDEVAPEITVTGVADGGSYSPPVTITIAVEPGTYTATLNGAAFFSGGTVTQPGAYTLIVNGRNGLETSHEEIDFTLLAGGTGDVLIVRVFDLLLGSNTAPGDAILITDSSGSGMTHALIDAGARSNSETYVRTRLVALGVDTLRFMQLTHAHFDHYSGMDEILNSALHVRSFVYNGQLRSAVTYNAVLSAAATQADTVTPLTALLTLELGAGPVATHVTMVPPLPTYIGIDTDDGDELNEGSVGTEVEHAGFRMFFTGDGEVLANQRWRTSFASLTAAVDVLKAGHHGANNAVFDDGFGTSTASAWLDHTQPTIAVISANGTTHPRVRALSKLMGETTEVYCTNVHGEIRITVDDAGFYTVQVEKNAGLDCVAGIEATT